MTPADWTNRFSLFLELLCVPARVDKEVLAAIAREQFAQHPRSAPESAARGYYLTRVTEHSELLAVDHAAAVPLVL
jgi:hypothetical protein